MGRPWSSLFRSLVGLCREIVSTILFEEVRESGFGDREMVVKPNSIRKEPVRLLTEAREGDFLGQGQTLPFTSSSQGEGASVIDNTRRGSLLLAAESVRDLYFARLKDGSIIILHALWQWEADFPFSRAVSNERRQLAILWSAKSRCLNRSLGVRTQFHPR